MTPCDSDDVIGVICEIGIDNRNRKDDNGADLFKVNRQIDFMLLQDTSSLAHGKLATEIM